MTDLIENCEQPFAWGVVHRSGTGAGMPADAQLTKTLAETSAVAHAGEVVALYHQRVVVALAAAQGANKAMRMLAEQHIKHAKSGFGAPGYGLIEELLNVEVSTEHLEAYVAKRIDEFVHRPQQEHANTLYLAGFDAEGKRVVSFSTTSSDPRSEADLMSTFLDFERAFRLRQVDFGVCRVGTLCVTPMEHPGIADSGSLTGRLGQFDAGELEQLETLAMDSAGGPFRSVYPSTILKLIASIRSQSQKIADLEAQLAESTHEAEG